MAKRVQSKYGYEPPEWIQADARLDKWWKRKKRLADKKTRGVFKLENKSDLTHKHLHDVRI